MLRIAWSFTPSGRGVKTMAVRRVGAGCGPSRAATLRKQTMSMTGKFSLGLLAAFVAVVLASPQAATQTAQQGGARDSVIRKCINQADRDFPGGESQVIQRSEAYTASMVSSDFVLCCSAV